MLIAEQFPDTAGSIISFKVDSDIISLDGKEPLETQAEVGDDGKLHVTVRKSTSSRMSPLQSSRNPTPRGSSFNHTDFYSMVNGKNANMSPRHSNFGNYGLDEESGVAGFGERKWGLWSGNVGYPVLLMPESFSGHRTGVKEEQWWGGGDCGNEIGVGAHPKGNYILDYENIMKTWLRRVQHLETNRMEMTEGLVVRSSSTTELRPKIAQEETKATAMPPASVMTRLILIMVWRKLIRNPNTYSSLIGLTWSLVSFKWNVQMPAIIAKSISILSDAGLGMAMFSLGMFVVCSWHCHSESLPVGKQLPSSQWGVRFTGPAVMAAASIAVGLSRQSPCGIVPFASPRKAHPDILSTGYPKHYDLVLSRKGRIWDVSSSS
ncbi:hypothetical protein HAX54_005280 [Datura stramonium]|uniref:PIN-like protein n=1 Tax=Datura stramonium TaxID=4076 RepID=A0ABS8WVW7_DATST|nr:hypothetical protein [Datura stramonium]